MRQAVDEMQASEQAIAAAREEEARLSAVAAKQKLIRVRLNVGGSGGVQLGLHVPKQVWERAAVKRALGHRTLKGWRSDSSALSELSASAPFWGWAKGTK